MDQKVAAILFFRYHIFIVWYLLYEFISMYFDNLTRAIDFDQFPTMIHTTSYILKKTKNSPV